MTPEIPEASPAAKALANRLVGLPFVCLVDSPQAAQCFCCQLTNGQKVRIVELEEIFNAGLVIDAMEGPGTAARQTLSGGGASELHHELLRQAERKFGITIADALPLYLEMDRTEYARWDERPRVKWPRPTVN